MNYESEENIWNIMMLEEKNIKMKQQFYPCDGVTLLESKVKDVVFKRS